MLMMIVVSGVIGMVKQSPFQQDLFDFNYIENQVAEIKKSMDKENDYMDEQQISEILNNQLVILENIQQLLSEIDDNTKKKTGLIQRNKTGGPSPFLFFSYNIIYTFMLLFLLHIYIFISAFLAYTNEISHSCDT